MIKAIVVLSILLSLLLVNGCGNKTVNTSETTIPSTGTKQPASGPVSLLDIDFDNQVDQLELQTVLKNQGYVNCVVRSRSENNTQIFFPGEINAQNEDALVKELQSHFGQIKVNIFDVMQELPKESGPEGGLVWIFRADLSKVAAADQKSVMDSTCKSIEEGIISLFIWESDIQVIRMGVDQIWVQVYRVDDAKRIDPQIRSIIDDQGRIIKIGNTALTVPILFMMKWET